MTDFSPSEFLNVLYNKYYLKEGINLKTQDYTNDWCSMSETLCYVKKQLAFQGDEKTIENNIKKHYELLRLIIYKSCDYSHHEKVIEFIKDILFIPLEQEAISLAHIVPNNSDLYLLLSKFPLYNIFNDKTDNVIKISNTSVHKLLSNINTDKDIYKAIEEHTKPRKRRANFEDAKITKISRVDNKTGGKKTKRRRSKKSKKSKKYKKYKKSKKSNKYRK